MPAANLSKEVPEGVPANHNTGAKKARFVTQVTREMGDVARNYGSIGKMAPEVGLAVHSLVIWADSREVFHILKPHLYTLADPSIGDFIEGWY